MRPIQDLYTHTLTLECRDAASKYDSKVNMFGGIVARTYNSKTLFRMCSWDL